VNKAFGSISRFTISDAEQGVSLYKKNQIGVGTPNFNVIAFWFVLMPGMIVFVSFIHHCLHYVNDPENLPEGVSSTELAVKYMSYTAAWAGTVVLSFFLIPVTRHSVLLVPMNWSPVHTLRLHIWAGHVSFFLMSLHGFMILGVWIKWSPGEVYEEFVPTKNCWTGNP
jgi:hypothetical protein